MINAIEIMIWFDSYIHTYIHTTVWESIEGLRPEDRELRLIIQSNFHRKQFMNVCSGGPSILSYLLTGSGSTL
jgi:hypothetical protein